MDAQPNHENRRQLSLHSHGKSWHARGRFQAATLLPAAAAPTDYEQCESIVPFNELVKCQKISHQLKFS